MKVIFLDFDGVLNTENYQVRRRSEGLPVMDSYGHLFDPEAIANLGSILEAVPDAKIVVESSWKVMGLLHIRQMWKARNLPGEIYDATPDISTEALLTADLSDPEVFQKLEGAQKAAEINAWLREKDCQYIIIDDVAKFSGEMARRHIKVNPEEGLTSIKALKAIDALLFL